jgi:hypothetical protein
LKLRTRWTPACSPRLGSTRLVLHSGPIVKGSPDNTLPATRPAPGNSRWRPDKANKKTPRSFPRAGFSSLSGFSSGVYFSSPRTSCQALRSWLWSRASIFSRQIAFDPGDKKRERAPRRARCPVRAYFSEMRDVLTEVIFLSGSDPLTLEEREGSQKSAAKDIFFLEGRGIEVGDGRVRPEVSGDGTGPPVFHLTNSPSFPVTCASKVRSPL